ncbi:mitogen-activated protein kinase kinase kinase [Sarracenia purpurea var. burkii]
MNATLKQNRILRERIEEQSFCSTSKENSNSDAIESASFHPDGHDETSGEKSMAYYFHRKQINPQKAISLPSSPRQFRASRMCEATKLTGSADVISSWNKVLESSKTFNKLLLPFEEWNIDFSEMTVGTRVGIGKYHVQDYQDLSRVLLSVNLSQLTS